MDWLHLVILAIVQGLTEFLPVSSSAHLILPAQILQWQDQGPLIDLMAHLGSLLAVMLYYRRETSMMISGGFDWLSMNPARRTRPAARLALLIAISAPPTLIAGLYMSVAGWDELVRNPAIIAWAMIGFGIVLWLSDVWAKNEKTYAEMTWRHAAIIGLSQMIALIPGTSRSGITMTAARGLGFSREEAARFSMLMAIPIIGAGGLYAFLKLVTGNETGTANWQDGLWVAGLSFIAAYFAIFVFMKLIARISFFPFMVYRAALGAIILWWLTSGAPS